VFTFHMFYMCLRFTCFICINVSHVLYVFTFHMFYMYLHISVLFSSVLFYWVMFCSYNLIRYWLESYPKITSAH